MTDTLTSLRLQTDVLLRTAAGLDTAALRTPSLCTGWSRAHVLAHLGLNAEGLSRLVRAAVDGSGESMYAGSAERDADIDARSTLSAAQLLDLLQTSAAELAVALSRVRPEHAQVRVERTPGGVTFTAGSLASRRLTEVVYHHVDLDAGFGFGDLDDDLLERLLTDEIRAATGASHDDRARALLRPARARDPR